MAEQVMEAAACVHACQEGCGRPYDVITILIVDGSTLFHCLPCSQQFAYQLMRAMVEPDSADVQEVVDGASFEGIAMVEPGVTGYTLRLPEYVPPEDEFQFTGED